MLALSMGALCPLPLELPGPIVVLEILLEPCQSLASLGRGHVVQVSHQGGLVLGEYQQLVGREPLGHRTHLVGPSAPQSPGGKRSHRRGQVGKSMRPSSSPLGVSVAHLSRLLAQLSQVAHRS